MESLGSESPREEHCVQHGYTGFTVHSVNTESDDDESLIEVIFPYAEDGPREDASANKIREISYKVGMDNVGRNRDSFGESQEKSNFQKIREL